MKELENQLIALAQPFILTISVRRNHNKHYIDCANRYLTIFD